MKFNKWTLALAAAGVVSLGSAAQAEEAQNQVLTALSSTTLSGYVDTSAIWKIGTGNGALPGRAYDGAGKMDGFNLNVVKLSLEKPLDESQYAAGYKVDLLFGPDATAFEGFTAGFGNDIAIQQAYVNLRAPVGTGLDIKIGAFDSIIGYESFDSWKNPNYSRSYGYILGPKQHTGVLASYQLSDYVAVAGGVANTHTSAINGRSTRGSGETQKAFLGAITVTAPESLGFLEGATLYSGIVDGFAGNAANDTTSLYAGAAVPTPVEGLSIGAAWDYLFDNAANAVTVPTANVGNWAYSIAGYASYQATEKLKLNGRVDYATGSDGTFAIAALAGDPDPQVKLISYTLTADYNLWGDNVVTRAEVRWDRSLSGDKLYGGNANADLDKNAFTVAANVIYKF